MQGLLSVKLVHKQDHLASVNRMHALYAEAAALGESARETPASNVSAGLPACFEEHLQHPGKIANCTGTVIMR